MPLPVAHGLVGASVVALWRPSAHLSDDWPKLALGAFLAISPDFDFILVWGWHMRGLHRGPTHSILMAVVVTLLMLAAMGLSQAKNALAYGSAFLSHTLLDFSATKIGGGVQLFWPFMKDRFKLGLSAFSDFPHGFNLRTAALACLVELLVFAPVLAAILLFRKYLFRAHAQEAV